ncbi:MAG: HAD family hydrolase [Planctomycetota bacterium]|jgi:beta-phosphoglucomutase family hydrolase
MAIAAMIFDLDGVLIDSAAPHHESWRLLAGELGARVTEEQFLTTFGRQNRDIIPLLFGDHLSDKRVGELSERKEAIYRDLVRGRIQPIAGAVELARGCRRAGLKLAVGSSGHPANIDLALQELGIAECFDVIVHGNEVTRGKPDPQVFLTAAQRLELPPADCAVIEDAPSGVQAALAAGMTAIGLTTHHPRERLSAAHRVIDSLLELTPQGIVSM